MKLTDLQATPAEVMFDRYMATPLRPSAGFLSPNWSREELRSECEHLLQRYHVTYRRSRRRPKRPHTVQFLTQLAKGRRYLLRGLAAAPFDRKRFGRYRQSYEVLNVRLASLRKHLGEAQAKPCLPEVPSAHQDIQMWQDWVDEAELIVDAYEQGVRQEQERDWLLTIEMLDALQRVDLTKPTVPVEIKESRWLGVALKTLRQACRRYLFQSEVRPIALQVGEYPPVEQTRLVSAQQDSFGDNIVIAEILETGYRWRKFVLRRATVTVTSRWQES